MAVWLALAAAIAVIDPAPSGNPEHREGWTRGLSELLIAPANARGLSAAELAKRAAEEARRSADKAAEDARRAAEALKQAQADQLEAQKRLRQINNLANAVRRSLHQQRQQAVRVEKLQAEKKIEYAVQQADEMRKRVQQTAEEARQRQLQHAAEEAKRRQVRQVAEEAKRRQQQSQANAIAKPHPAHSLAAAQQKVQAQQAQTQATLKRAQEMRAKYSPAASQAATPKAKVAVLQQVQLQKVMAKLRPNVDRRERANPADRAVAHVVPVVPAGKVGHHHAVLLTNISKPGKTIRRSDHGNDAGAQGHRQPQQQAIYGGMLAKLTNGRSLEREKALIGKIKEAKKDAKEDRKATAQQVADAKAAKEKADAAAKAADDKADLAEKVAEDTRKLEVKLQGKMTNELGAKQPANSSNKQNDQDTPDLPVRQVVADASGGKNKNNNSNDNDDNDWGSPQRLGGPQQPKQDDNSGQAKTKKDDTKKDDARKDDARKDDAKKDDARRADGKKDTPNPDYRSLKQAGRGLGKPVPREQLMVRLQTVMQREVLAINVDVERLKQAGHQVTVRETVDLKALGYTVSRLEIPEQVNPSITLGMLFKDFPADGFTFNRIYTQYRTQGEATPSGAPTKAAASAPLPSSAKPIPAALPPGGGLNLGAGCPAERCFAPALIEWRPQLAACAHGMKIGVIDTGFDRGHPAFIGARIKGADDDILPPGSSKASSLHGTAVLSLLAGNAASSTPGLVPEANFYFRNAFFADQNGNAMSSTLTMLKALNWMKENRVDVLNLSFAGPKDQLVHDAIMELAKGGTAVFAAVGNDGPDAADNFPAAYAEVVAVTAVDRNMRVYAYANRGTHIAVAAPGVDVWTALPGKREGVQTGTSFAVPFATSVVALNYRAEENRSGNAGTPRQRALELLRAKPIGGSRRDYGAGLVRAPVDCGTRTPGPVAGRSNGWFATMQVVPATVSALPSWTSTVHPTAKAK